MNIRIDMAQLLGDISALAVGYPELADDEVLRSDMIQGATNIDELLSRILEECSHAEAIAGAIKARMDDLGQRKVRYDRQSEGLRALIQTVLERADLKKYVLPEATLSVSYRAPSPIVSDETIVPDELCKFKRAPDMAKIKAAIASGSDVRGVTMSNGKSVLTIRTK